MLMQKIILTLKIIIGTGLGTGFIPFAPATFASLIIIPLILVLNSSPIGYLIMTIAFFFIGVLIADDLEKIWGKDSRKITIDEWTGMLITFFLITLPVTLGKLIAVLLTGFFLFRFFDIFKLPLIRKAQAIKGGWGVMIDDLLAAVVANLSLRFLIVIFL
uniref:Phosphatidylglycerophosphatase A n=1 Tax=candidate division WOR-3 bacterium TaxID=2052148 RepID=A0A7C6A908_UNCW3